MRRHAWLIANLTACVVTVGAGYFVVAHRQDIQDWWALRSYTPPAQIKELADNNTMIGVGRDLFYVSTPQVEDSDQFNVNCSKAGEKSLVLGCYAAQRIYIYNVTDERIKGVKEVTAAHEMLHAVYERLDDGEKERLNAMLQTELPKVTDDRLKGLIALYESSEPGQLLNEMHSILGTEYANLSPELETYYKQYFGDRSKVVGYAMKYESVFTASKNRLVELETQLDSMKKQIDTNNADIIAKKAALDTRVQQLTALRSTDPAAYNKQVPGYNSDVYTYNNLVVATRALVDSYNKLVVEHNNEVASQSDLYHSLDSHYQTVSN